MTAILINEALIYYRELAQKSTKWPIRFSDSKFYCTACRAVAFGKSDLIHAASCRHEAMEKVYRERMQRNVDTT